MTSLHQRKASLRRELKAVNREINAGKPARVIQQRVQPSGAGQRQPRERDNTYLQWIRRLPCVKCMARAYSQNGRTEAAHNKLAIASHGWREAGLSEKSDDRKALPLCGEHHRWGLGGEHRMGQRRFWDDLGICPATFAAHLVAAHEAGREGGDIIEDFLRGDGAASRSRESLRNERLNPDSIEKSP